MAKLLVYAVWAVALSMCLAALLLLVGLIAGLGPLATETWIGSGAPGRTRHHDRGDRRAGRVGSDRSEDPCWPA